MRKGIMEAVLNVVIALLLTGVTIGASFFVYENVVSSMSGAKVLQGFQDFITPIQSACNGKTSFSTGLTLPTNTPYTYAVVQTRVRSGDKLASPVMKGACTNSYCLCLLRMPTKNYNTWKISPNEGLQSYMITIQGQSGDDKTIDEPAPLWHFNAPGTAFFPPFIKRMIYYAMIDVISSLVIRLVGQIVIDAACGPGAIACAVAVGALYYAMAEALKAFILTQQKELTKPLIAVNYPSNILTTGNPEFLYWKNEDNQFMCDINAQWGADVRKDDALRKAIAASFEAAIAGAIKGALVGLKRGMSNAGIGLILRYAIVTAGYAIAGSATLYEKLSFGRIVNLFRMEIPTPSNLRPDCYTLDVLSARSNVDLNDWVREGWNLPLSTTHDQGIYNMTDVDILNCVGIADLGPLCNEDTKILVDYNYDFFYFYRLVDPINDMASAIYCEYAQHSQDYEIDLTQTILRNLGIDLSGPILELANFVIENFIVPGITSIGGLMMECGNPGIIPNTKSEYFQYWIPYYDSQAITGYDGQIPYLTASLVDKTATEEQTCRSAVEASWQSCLDDPAIPECYDSCYRCITECDIESSDGESLNYKACCAGSPCDYNRCCVQKELCDFSDCPVSAIESGLDKGDGKSGFELLKTYYQNLKVITTEALKVDPTDLNSAPSVNDYIKPQCEPCYDKWYPSYHACTSGVHLKIDGVMI